MASLPYPRRPLDNSPTEFTEPTEVSGARYSPTDFTDAHRLGGYGIPAIPTPPSANPPTEFTEFTEISGVEEPPTDAHRCSQIVRLRRLLWGDSLVAAWVWQGCHTLLICAHPCHLWENILRHKLLWVLWFLWGDSLVSAWVWQDAIPS